MTPEELERRRTVVGASEAGLLFGLKAFGGKTIADMDFEKRYGMERESKGNQSTDFGKKFEKDVLDWAEEKLESQIIDRQKWLTLGCNGATLDGRVEECGAVIDAKTSGIFGPSKLSEWGDELSDSIPEFYIVQLNAQMLVTGAELAYLAALIGGRGFAMFRAEPSQGLMAEIERRSREFILSLSTDVVYPEPPQLDTLKRIRRDPGKTLPRSDRTDELWERLSEAKASAKTSDEAKELAERKWYAAMQDADAVQVPDGLFTYLERTVQYKPKLASEATFRFPFLKKGG